MADAVRDTAFPPKQRPPTEPNEWTPEKAAAWEARQRSGYYIPGIGAFDTHEGPRPDAFTVDSPQPIAFHIGQSYDSAPATQHACAACGCIVFHLGVGHWYTALRCVNCGREWCQHSG